MKRTVLAFLLATSTSVATSVLHQDLSDVVHKADRGFLGSVTEVRSEWCAAESRAYTKVTFHVERDLLGNLASSEVSLRLLGGTAARPDGEVVRQVVYGMPTFQVGERTVVFASNDARLYCPVVGWFQGRYRVKLDARTGADRVYDDAGLPVTSIGSRDVKVSADGEAVTLVSFLARVAEMRSAPSHARTSPPSVERVEPCGPVGDVRLLAQRAPRKAPRTRREDEGAVWPYAAAIGLAALGVLLGIRRK